MTCIPVFRVLLKDGQSPSPALRDEFAPEIITHTDVRQHTGLASKSNKSLLVLYIETPTENSSNKS